MSPPSVSVPLDLPYCCSALTNILPPSFPLSTELKPCNHPAATPRASHHSPGKAPLCSLSLCHSCHLVTGLFLSTRPTWCISVAVCVRIPFVLKAELAPRTLCTTICHARGHLGCFHLCANSCLDAYTQSFGFYVPSRLTANLNIPNEGIVNQNYYF